MATATAFAPGRSVSRPVWQQLRTFLVQELKPAPGRMRAALIRVGGVVLGMWVGYGLNVPEISAVLALTFFAASADRSESKKVALGVPPAVLVILLLLTLVLTVFGTSPFVRTLCWIVIIFGSLFLLQAAQQGQIFLLTGVFCKVFLELWDTGYPSALTQELSLWIVIDLALAGLCALFLSTLFGKPAKRPGPAFRAKLARQFELAARVLTSPTPSSSDMEQLQAQAFADPEAMIASLDTAAKSDQSVRVHHDLFAGLIRVAPLLLHECLLLRSAGSKSEERSRSSLQWSAERAHAIAHLVRAGNLVDALEPPVVASHDTVTQQLVDTLQFTQALATGLAALPPGTPYKKKAFLRADAFTNPAYFSKAARAFAAAFACYCLVSGADWSGIGTAVTTCLITSLMTVEQSRQKQSLRIAGATVGAVLTFLAMVAILPSGVGLGGLTVVTIAITFAGAWVFAGGPNLNYAGVQIVLCFFLGVFGENKVPTSLTSVRDRVAGIFIGNLAMWLFYDRIRPAWTVNSSRCAFAEEAEAIARLSDAHEAPAWHMEAIQREREAFTQARASLLAMSDSASPAFTPWAKAQQQDAPGVRAAEASLSLLFSLTYVRAASGILGAAEQVPSSNAQPQTSPSVLSPPLRALAAALRNGRGIPPCRVSALSESSRPVEAVLCDLQNNLAAVFASDASARH